MLSRYFVPKLLTLIVFSLVSALARPAAAGGFGMGLLVQASPFYSGAGLSMAGSIGDKFTLAGAVLPAFGDFRDQLYGHVDFLFDLGEGFETGGGPIKFYFGPGVRFLVLDIDGIGARVPVGMKYNINDTAVEFFVEAAPAIDFFIDMPPTYQIEFQGGMGIRYYFAGSKANKAGSGSSQSAK